jgi:hypothetical protein
MKFGFMVLVGRMWRTERKPAATIRKYRSRPKSGLRSTPGDLSGNGGAALCGDYLLLSSILNGGFYRATAALVTIRNIAHFFDDR